MAYEIIHTRCIIPNVNGKACHVWAVKYVNCYNGLWIYFCYVFASLFWFWNSFIFRFDSNLDSMQFSCNAAPCISVYLHTYSLTFLFTYLLTYSLTSWVMYVRTYVFTHSITYGIAWPKAKIMHGRRSSMSIVTATCSQILHTYSFTFLFTCLLTSVRTCVRK